MPGAHEGGCICGRVRYSVDGEPARVTICHCAWCQRRTGSAFGVEVVLSDSQVTFTGDPPSVYRHISDESGRWLDQRFCPHCATKLGLNLEAIPGWTSIPAGTFDDPSWIARDRQSFRDIYVRSARDWAAIPDGVEVYEEHFRK